MRELKTRHVRKTERKKKGPVGPGEKEEEESDKLENFFYHVYEFHNPVSPSAPDFVPAELPARYAINFVPVSAFSVVSASTVPSDPSFVSVSAVPDPSPICVNRSVTSNPVAFTSSPATDYSVVFSVNFTCIQPN